MVQVQENTSSNLKADSDYSILNDELWQATLHNWISIAKKVPKNHAVWRILSEIYQDFIGNDFDKDKGIQLLAEFVLFAKPLEKQSTINQTLSHHLLYKKLRAVWQHLSEEYPLQLPQALLESEAIGILQAKDTRFHHLDPAHFQFVLVGVEVYAQSFFSLSIKEKNHKVLLKNQLATYFIKNWLEYLPKRGAKAKIADDFFWHFDSLVPYFVRVLNPQQSHFPASLTWGRLAQIKSATWQSLQATLFSPISELQESHTRLQKSQFTLILSDTSQDFHAEFCTLAAQGIWVGLLPKSYFKSQEYAILQKEWEDHFSEIYQWNLPKNEQAWVFAIKTEQKASPSLQIKQFDCPPLQSPLSWLALRQIFEAQSQHLLEEKPLLSYSKFSQKISPLENNGLTTYPLLGQETNFGTLGEGIFAYSFEGLTLAKQASLWSDKPNNLHDLATEYLKEVARESTKQTLFEIEELTFDSKKITEIGLNPFQTVYFYAQPSHWVEGARLAKVFNVSLRQPFLHLALHQDRLDVFATEYPVARNFMGKTLTLSRHYYEKTGKVRDNIRAEALAFFKAHYESQWQAKAEDLRLALNTLLNLSILEECQVEPELALEMRLLAQLSENIPFAKQLFESIYKPNATTLSNFKSLKEIFLRTQRSFEQMGKKQSRGKESYDTLKNYFEEGVYAIQVLDDFLEEAQRKEINLEREISTQAIFEYTYAVLQLLKPNNTHHLKALQVPLYEDFWAWTEAGARLLELHLKPAEVSGVRPLNIEEKYLRKGIRQFKVRFLPDEKTVVLQDKHIEWCIRQVPAEVFELYLGTQLAFQWVLVALPLHLESNEDYSFLEIQPETTQLYLQKHIRWIVETVRIKRLLEML